MNRLDKLEKRSIYIIREVYNHIVKTATQFLPEKPSKFCKVFGESRVYQHFTRFFA